MTDLTIDNTTLCRTDSQQFPFGEYQEFHVNNLYSLWLLKDAFYFSLFAIELIALYLSWLLTILEWLFCYYIS